jgi:hypothetical protein
LSYRHTSDLVRPVLFLSCFFVFVTGVWAQGLSLLGKHSTTWAASPALAPLLLARALSCSDRIRVIFFFSFHLDLTPRPVNHS